jgi:outer membrane biosynthesis protein TonB
VKRRTTVQVRRPAPSGLDRVLWAVPFVLIALIAQVPIALSLGLILQLLEPEIDGQSAKPIHLAILQPDDRDEPDPEEEEEEEEIMPDSGQIIEIAPPEDETPPEEAEYLAEYDSTVPEETKVDRTEVNPEIVAPVYSEEQRYEQQDLLDMNVDKESTGATPGQETFDLDKHGSMASLPSAWTVTNKLGLQDPVPSSHKDAFIAGAPQNDMLLEKRGDKVAVNAREFIYAGYLNRIKRLVNYYWKQNVDNLPSSVRLAKPRYFTEIKAILNADGALELIEVTHESGSSEMDNCVEAAFKLAGPFPNPPEGLIAKDGRVYLPDMGFTVTLGQAHNQYQGIDPRAGVQFPGILKAPR